MNGLASFAMPVAPPSSPADVPRFSFQFLGSATIDVPGLFTVALSWPIPLLWAVASVCAFTALVCRQTEPTPSEAVKRHYTQMCVYSAATFLAFVGYVAVSPEEHTLLGWACTPPPAWVRAMSLIFLASKVWEWRDSVILRGSKSLYEIGFLHLFHHATTMLVWLAALNFPGSEKGLYLNAAVHAIMYYHFAFRLPKFVRPFITLFQLAQFAIAFATHAYTVSVPCNQGRRGSGLEAAFPFWLVGVYVLYFIRFFYTTYVAPRPHKPKVI